MDRISEKNLRALCDRLNAISGSPAEAYRHEGGKMVANVGNYHLSFAYGGVCLHRMSNESGGVSSVFGLGHVSKRELWDRMHAYLEGFEAGWKARS